MMIDIDRATLDGLKLKLRHVQARTVTHTNDYQALNDAIAILDLIAQGGEPACPTNHARRLDNIVIWDGKSVMSERRVANAFCPDCGVKL
jgi:hypothetical protein